MAVDLVMAKNRKPVGIEANRKAESAVSYRLVFCSALQGSGSSGRCLFSARRYIGLLGYCMVVDAAGDFYLWPAHMRRVLVSSK